MVGGQQGEQPKEQEEGEEVLRLSDSRLDSGYGSQGLLRLDKLKVGITQLTIVMARPL